MRRADRLFRIVQYLRGRRLTTAAFLAGRLGVSLRTVYRDVRDLSLSGVPVEGEAGVGYRLRAGFDVPPLMFTLNEIEALAVGARMVEAWGGPVLAESARSAASRSTVLFDSVAELVNTTQSSSTPSARATAVRAPETSSRAAAPAQCTLEGLPNPSRSATSIASTASGRSGVVAL